MALAGSRPRAADPASDDALGRMLLASAKDRTEHRMVVEAIVADLAGLGIDVAAEGPRLRRLAGLQHLETLLTGDLPPGWPLLDIVAALHPTPALGGWPSPAALELIARHEALPDGRGWYGGGLGWLDGRGEGDVSVGIRGLRVRGRLATVYAGAGLVADSDPASEAAEIAVKMAAALSALGDPVPPGAPGGSET
jgi:isochorismate synthase EntC